MVSDVAVQVLRAGFPPVASEQLGLGSVRAEPHPTDGSGAWFWVSSVPCVWGQPGPCEHWGWRVHVPGLFL